jgi:hypothetical protein
MGYSLGSDARELLSLLTEDVVADTAVGSLSLARCRQAADGAIDEAARAGNYDAPFSVTSTASGPYASIGWVRDASAIGTVVYARRGLESVGAAADGTAGLLFEKEFEARLERLRKGEVDLGTAVHTQALTIPAEYYTWASLDKRGLVQGSARMTDDDGLVEFVEERWSYDETYRLGVAKDYEVDHVRGKVRALPVGRIAPGASVVVSYTHFVKQPAMVEEEQAKARTVEAGQVARTDFASGQRAEQE